MKNDLILSNAERQNPEAYRTERSIRRKALFDLASAAHLASHNFKELGVSGQFKMHLNNLIRGVDRIVKDFELFAKRLNRAALPEYAADPETVIDAMHTNGALLYETARWFAFLTPENAEKMSDDVQEIAMKYIQIQAAKKALAAAENAKADDTSA